MSTGQHTRRDALRTAAALACGAVSSAGVRAVAATEPKHKILYFTKSSGFEHSVVRRKGKQLAHSERILIDLGARHGFDVTCSKDGSVFEGDHLQFDGYVFYTTGDLTRVGKDGGVAMSAKGKQALLDAIGHGKGFIGIHSATDTFHSKGDRRKNQDAVDPYIAMIGGEFVSHGKQQRATMTVADPHFPGMESLGASFQLHDEWYALKNFSNDLHVLLVNETKGMEGDVYQRPAFPATWARLHEKGHVFYTSMGHREDVWTNPLFQGILANAMRWVTHGVTARTAPNLKQAAPGAAQLQPAK